MTPIDRLPPMFDAGKGRRFSIRARDGVSIRARTDIALASKWVRYETGWVWDEMSKAEQATFAAQALATVRKHLTRV